MNKKKIIYKFIAIMLSITMVVGMTPVTAATDKLPIGASSEIIAFEELPEGIAVQSVSLGASEADLDLPDTLNATVRLATLEEEPVPDSGETDLERDSTDMVSGSAISIDETEEAGDSIDDITVTLPVTWASSPKYDRETAGTYLFTPELPEGYILADGIDTPQIIITVGLAMRLALASTGADYSWYDSDTTAAEFEINSTAQLKGLTDIVNGNRGAAVDFSGKTIKLTTSLNLSGHGNWTPIGTVTAPFAGVFDGNLNTISYLTNTSGGNYLGLFGYITGSVSNLFLTSVNVTGTEHVGALAGQSMGNISNCAVVDGTVRGNYRVGGLVGRLGGDYNTGNTISSSFTTCSVALTGASPANAGGIVGSLSGNVTNCYSTASVSGPSYSGSYGGIAGSARGGSSIKSCFSTGAISGYTRVGGIVGSVVGNVTIANNAALNPSVRAGEYFVGRVVGGENSATTIGNIAYAYMTCTYSGSIEKTLYEEEDGITKTLPQIATDGFFAANGFSSDFWQCNSERLPALTAFPIGLNTGVYPSHMSRINPTAPQNVGATIASGQIALSWKTPANPGRSEIKEYVVQIGATQTSVGMSMSHTFTGLTNGTSYVIKVWAVNNHGTGDLATIQKTPGAAPSAPQNLQVTSAQNEQATITWSAPANGGTGGVTGYRYYYNLPDSYSDSVTTSNLSATTPRVLLNGHTYKFYVRAVNPYGESAAVTVSATVIGVPYRPSYLSASPSNGKVTLSWSPSLSGDGGSPIIRYEVYNPLVSAWESTALNTTYTITGLTNGTSYAFKVRAVNVMGNGTEAQISSTPKEAPTITSTGSTSFQVGMGGTMQVTATGTATITYSLSGQPSGVSINGSTGLITVAPSLPAGIYSFNITAANGQSPNATQAFILTINKADNTLVISCAGITYGEIPDPFVNRNISGGTVSYEYKAQGADDSTYTSAVPTDAGSYTVRGTSTETAYYSSAKATADFTIGKADNILSIFCSNITYGQTPSPEVDTNTSGGAVTWEYKLQGADDSTYTPIVPTTVGNYTVRGISAATVNYNAVTATVNFAIHKADSALSISCADIAYGEPPAPTVETNDSGGTVSYEYKVQGADDSTYTPILPTTVGNYTVRGIATATVNYNAATATADFAIHKAESTLNISCADITYGVTPAPTVETNASGGTVSYEYKVQGTDDSTYTLIVPTVVGNYTVRGIATATVNYNAATATADFAIHKATLSLTLTANPTGSQVRPGSVELTATLPADATGTLTFKSGSDTIATVALPDNTADFTPTGAANEYSFTAEYSGDRNYNSAASTVLKYSFIKSEQADVIASNGTVSCGEMLDLSALVSGGSGTGLFSFSLIDGPGEINGTTLTPTGVGDVNIIVTKAEDDDYNDKSADFKVTVNPRVITFTVASVGIQTYTGSPVTPAPEVRDGTTVLTEGVHFTCVYHDNTNVGTSAAVYITGIGSYAGSVGSVTFTIGGAVPSIIMPPTVSGTVYTGTALSQIVLTGGEASVSGHFEWVIPTAAAAYGSNTFEARFVPDDSVLYAQVAGISINFTAVNRVRYESSDDSGSIVPAANLNQPTVASVTAVPLVTNGHATLTITDSMVKKVIDKALADAIAKGSTANGISVDISVKATSANGFAVTLKREALNRLLDAGVKAFSISGLPVNMSFDTEAVKEILKQSDGNVVISIKPVTAAGLRNTYDITICYTENGKPAYITSLDTGTSTLGIYTVPGKDESVGCLFGAYVGADKKINRITDSVYDANSRRMIFSTNHFSVYGVVYTAPSARLIDTSSHWAKDSIDYVVSRGLLVSGIDGKFQPDTAITLRDCITALGRLSDVNASHFSTGSYFSYFIWAYRKGILNGVTGSLFAPNRTITREEIAVIISNYANATGFTLPVTREAANFKDASSIGSVYRTAVNSVQQAGILTGGSGNKFNPKANVTRAELSVILHRYIKLTIDTATTQGWTVNDAGEYLYYKDGAALTGWQMIGGVKYYFYPTGSLQTGWVQGGGNWYFFSGNTRLTGWCDFGANGNKKTYYFNRDGIMAAGGWLQIDSKWYYFYVDGSLARSTEVDGCEVDKNGVRKQ